MTSPEDHPIRTRLAPGASRPPLLDLRPGTPLPPLPRTAWLDIDLDCLVRNFEVLRAALAPGVQIVPVVKGDAYGHGAIPVARALAAAGARTFAVATYDEALELRAAGLRNPLLIVYPSPPELAESCLRQGFSITAGDATLLERTLAALARLGDEGPARRRRLPIHVEVETGLGRAGLHPTDVPAAVAAIAATKRARFAGLWSHLQAGGDAGRSAGQAERLGDAASLLEAAGVRLPARHLAASAGLLAATVPQLDAVRIGLALYGFAPDGLAVDETRRSVAAALEPILSLRARPIRVTELPPGSGISYGPTFVTGRDSRIATLPIGYADGYPRSLSNRAQALVRGGRVPVVGTVAMDAIMVDVTDVPGPPITVDDEFTLIGRQGDGEIGALEVGRWGNTISYEIVTAMSRRLPRVYYAAADAVGVRMLALERVRGRATPDGRRG